MCASSYLRFLSQIFTSSLSSSGLHILRPHLVFTRSDLHRRVTLSLSYHLQDFIMQLLSQLYNLIYLRVQNFISPRSRANRRLVGVFELDTHIQIGTNARMLLSLKQQNLQRYAVVHMNRSHIQLAWHLSKKKFERWFHSW